jgi:hypothetical protein
MAHNCRPQVPFPHNRVLFGMHCSFA